MQMLVRVFSSNTEIHDLVPVYGRHVNFLLPEEHDFAELDLSRYYYYYYYCDLTHCRS